MNRFWDILLLLIGAAAIFLLLHAYFHLHDRLMHVEEAVGLQPPGFWSDLLPAEKVK